GLGNYTFTKGDHGLHVFHVTLTATGSQTITAKDTVTSSITGSATTTVNPAPVATHLLVITPEHIPVGVPTHVKVEALDASNQLVANYTGTVQLTTSASTTLLVSAPFTATDHGIHLFTVTFGTSGKQTLTATDTANGTILGSTHVKVLT